MKIIGIGVDIIEIARMAKAAEKENFCRYVFTENELNYADGRGKQRAASLAARWAAKEAVLKALGTGLTGGMKFTEIEVLPEDFTMPDGSLNGGNKSGKPQAKLTGEVLKRAAGLGVKEVFISLSHGKDAAIAECILVG